MSEKNTKKLTREQQRELDVKISFMEGVVRRDPAYVEALQVLGDDYTKRGRYVAGLKVDEQLAQLRPDDALVQYNLACSYSLTGNFNQAAAALVKALDFGYRDFKFLAKDPDLHDLREHPAVQGHPRQNAENPGGEGVRDEMPAKCVARIFEAPSLAPPRQTQPEGRGGKFPARFQFEGPGGFRICRLTKMVSAGRRNGPARRRCAIPDQLRAA